MQTLEFTVPLYEIDVTLVQVEKPDDWGDVEMLCDTFGLDEEMTKAVAEHVSNNHKNGGDTFRNFEKGKMLVIFYRMDSDKVRANRYSHEKRHIEDRILQWCGVDNIEASAYLAGFLGEQFYEFENLWQEEDT